MTWYGAVIVATIVLVVCGGAWLAIRQGIDQTVDHDEEDKA